jgi:hypothetical protein
VNHPGLVGDLTTREDPLMSRQSPYPPELRRRAVRMVDEVRAQYDTEFAGFQRTNGGEVAVVRNGGPFNNNLIRQIIDPGSGNT